MNTILVTGGAGFIGFHTTKKLLERGDAVVVADNVNDYYDPTLKRDRLAELRAHPSSEKLTVKEINIEDYGALEGVFKEYAITHVFHAAAQAGVRYSLENPFTYERTNVLGFLNVLELMRHYHVQNLVYASSSSVYGANTKLPFAESDITDTPVSLYAATKKSNELMAHTYHHLFGMHTTGLRFFTVYGPWGRPDMALFLFAQKMRAGEPIDLYNEGNMKRDFTYVDDIVQGVVAAIDASYPCEVFNLAYGCSVPLLDYVDALEVALGVTAKRNLMPMQPGDVAVTNADISKAKEMLDYHPHTPVGEGVVHFAEWFNKYYGT